MELARVLSQLRIPHPKSGAELGPFVVGVDLSGDPTRGDVTPLLPVLR